MSSRHAVHGAWTKARPRRDIVRWPRLPALIGLVLVVATGCAGVVDPDASEPLDESLSHGSPDLGDPAVARIMGGFSPCTATLIGTRVLLTAAHCVEVQPSEVIFGPSEVHDDDRIAVRASATDPAFDAARIDHDLALLLLERAPTVQPVARIGEDETPTLLGDEVRIVGFGIVALAEPQSRDKRTGVARISAVSETELRLASDPSLPCLGDSGGPVFAGDLLIGVISSGDSACSDHARAMRVGAYRERFVIPQIEAWNRDAAVSGGGCSVADLHASKRRDGLFLVLGVSLARRRRVHSATRAAAPRARAVDLRRRTVWRRGLR